MSAPNLPSPRPPTPEPNGPTPATAKAGAAAPSFRPLAALLSAACCAASTGMLQSQTPKFQYPDTRAFESVDVYHGTTVIDRYRWLEDDNSPETKAWVEAQNKVTFGYLDQIPERTAIRNRLTQLWNYERFDTPVKRGGRYFISRNDGLQNQNVIYSMQSLDADPAVLLDPNQFSTDGTVSLSSIQVSADGSKLAYGLSRGGSDWQEWKVRDVATGRDLEDHLLWVKFSTASWRNDGSGFFYSRYDAPRDGDALKGINEFHKLYFHRIGTPQSADTLVYERQDRKDWGFAGQVTDDDRFLVISVWQGTDTRNRVFYKDLSSASSPVVELLNDFDAEYEFIDNDGTRFFFKTNLEAPRSRVIAIDVAQPERENWRQILPEAKETLTTISLVNERFIAHYLKDARSEVRVHSLEGRFLRAVALPGIGSARGFEGKKSDRETFYLFSGFTTPGTIYRYDVETGENSVFKQPKVAFDPAAFETRQVFYKSKDGTPVPMFITHRKGLDLNGKNPTLLYGYGGFNISITPSFSVPLLVWMEMGGVYAVPNLRGGGEYGETWHQAGMKLNKQNVFDDFIAAAEWLIRERYTTRKKLAIMGRSNGGLLVGACMTQRPDLFGAALPGVGVLDMLRFHKFTIGWAWTSDYGSPDDPQEFKALLAYSPYHNLKRHTPYPPTLITTADHDDRVVPAHSFKFAAALQAAHAGNSPVLIRIDTSAGHGAGKPTTKLIEDYTDMWGFLVRELAIQSLSVER